MRTGAFGRIAALLLGAASILLTYAPARAQPAPKRAQVAILSPFSSPEPGITAFRTELSRLGWIEGQNLETEVRWVDGRLDRLLGAAAELASLRPDVIFAPGEQGLMAAKQGVPLTSIVTVACDPLDRLIVSLAAPGGSATGLSCVHSDLASKRLDLLQKLLPGITRAAVLYNPSDPNKRREFQQLATAGRALQIALRAFEANDANAITAAFEAAASEGAQAVIVLVDAFTIFHRQRIADLALARRLPSVFGFKEFVEAGGLLSYGASREVLFRRAAVYVDKILKGAKPGELPVEEPTTFELYLNRRTAEALGLPIPATLLALADNVIE